jgi:hypothetical protein
MSAASGTYDGSEEREGTCWRQALAWMIHFVCRRADGAGLNFGNAITAL